MSEKELESYRFTSMEEPSDELLEQIMGGSRNPSSQGYRPSRATCCGAHSICHCGRRKGVGSRIDAKVTTSERRPVLIVVADPNASGKTTFTTQVLDHQWLKDSEYINPDYVALNNFGDLNDKDAVLKAANYCNEWREQCLAERRSMIFESVMSAKDKVDFVIRAKRAGFFIRLFFIATQSPVINAR